MDEQSDTDGFDVAELHRSSVLSTEGFLNWPPVRLRRVGRCEHRANAPTGVRSLVVAADQVTLDPQQLVERPQGPGFGFPVQAETHDGGEQSIG